MSEPKEGMNSGNIETMEIRLLEAVDHGIVATDTRGRITYWNRFAEHLTGFPKSIALGNSILDMVLFSPNDQQNVLQQFHLGGVWQGDCQFKPYNVELKAIPVRLGIAILRDSFGAHMGSAVSFYDLSNRIETVQKLAIGLAHEINQPLGAISNFAGGMIRGLEKSASTDTELCDTLKHIHAEAIRASKIVSRLRKSTIDD